MNRRGLGLALISPENHPCAYQTVPAAKRVRLPTVPSSYEPVGCDTAHRSAPEFPSFTPAAFKLAAVALKTVLVVVVRQVVCNSCYRHAQRAASRQRAPKRAPQPRRDSQSASRGHMPTSEVIQQGQSAGQDAVTVRPSISNVRVQVQPALFIHDVCNITIHLAFRDV